MSEYSSFIKELNQRIKGYNRDSSNLLFFNSILNITDEVLNSTIIAWILHLNNGSGNYWLVNEFLKRITVKNQDNHELIELINDIMHNQAPPVRIITEHQTKSGKKADIIIEWNNFSLIIENKTKSKEHDRQCEIYLEDSESKYSHLIYLTINGESPESLILSEKWKDSFSNFTYNDLVDCLDQLYLNIKKEKYNEFHRRIVEDYRMSIQYLIRNGVNSMNNEMDEKVKMYENIDDHIFWLFENKKNLNRLMDSGRSATQDIMISFLSRLKKNMESEFKLNDWSNDLPDISLPFAQYYYKDEWGTQINGLDIKFGYMFEFFGKNKITDAGFQIMNGERAGGIGIKIVYTNKDEYEKKHGNPKKPGNEKVKQAVDDLDRFRQTLNSRIKNLLRDNNIPKSNSGGPGIWAYLDSSNPVFSEVSEITIWIDETIEKFINLVKDTHELIDNNLPELLAK